MATGNDYRKVASQKASKYGLGNWFVDQIAAESNFNPTARSGAGALGIAQFMPGTAASVGVDPMNPVAALDAAAKLMSGYVRQYGDVSKALAAYNAGPGNVSRWQQIPETRNYVAKILQGQTPSATVTPSPPSAPATPAVAATPGVTLPGFTPARLPGVPVLNEGPLAQNVLGRFLSGGGRISLPGLASLTSSSWKTTPLPAPGGVAPVELPGMPGRPAQPGQKGQGQQTPGIKGKVFTASSADRQGVPTKQAVRDFVAQVAGVYGKPLTIGTGTNHNQYVAGTHRQSQHWTGDAADIPASGAELTRLGQDALIAAGMPVAEARKQTGGVFNVGGHNILFNTLVGGNHFNHLHVGV